MIATAERTTARILRWQLLEDSDRYEQRGWVEIDQCDLAAVGLDPDVLSSANVVLHAWLDHQDRDQPVARYRAHLPDGSRSDDVSWPRRARA